MYAYLCVQCGVKCWSSHESKRIERFIGEDKKTTEIGVKGLGTWKCPTHGKVKVRRMKENRKDPFVKEALAKCA